MKSLFRSAALACASVCISVGAAAPASAAVYLFDYQVTPRGAKTPDRVTFTIDTDKPRTNTTGIMIFDNLALTRNGVATTGTVQFTTNGIGVTGYDGVGGQTVFTGSPRAPVFTIGTLRFWNGSVLTIASAPSATGPVTGVPEPAGWAMMLAGFAGIGIATRRRARLRTRIVCA